MALIDYNDYVVSQAEKDLYAEMYEARETLKFIQSGGTITTETRFQPDFTKSAILEECKRDSYSKYYADYWATKEPDYLCFTAGEDNCIIGWNLLTSATPTYDWFPDLRWSTDKSNWTQVTNPSKAQTGTITTLNNGEKIYLKGINNAMCVWDYESEWYTYYFNFNLQQSVAASGDCTSLLNSTGELLDLSNREGAFVSLFEFCSALTTAPSLPSTTLAEGCYQGMFYGCTSLTTAPQLPATTLADWCYQEMFSDCTSLTTAPSLLATTLAEGCYYYMFYGCTSLTTAPQLPATTLAEYCYSGMFYGCTSLTTAPQLPATTLADWCYYEMFLGCTLTNVQDTVNELTSHIDFTSTTAPVGLQGLFAGLAITDEMLSEILEDYCLPATTLINNCYTGMFSYCTSLTTAPALPATTLTEGCYANMFYGCTSLTTAPALPATTLTEGCYEHMFRECTSLIIAPELPATTLSEFCYNGMFCDCTSLQTAPSLPATTLTDRCYMCMFLGCTSLVIAPSLPATTLISSCYSWMFNKCRNLKEISVSATIWNSGCAYAWVSYVSASGTFTKPSATTIPSGSSGIPNGWTVVNI